MSGASDYGSGDRGDGHAVSDVERLLSAALRPVEPPQRLSERVESRLAALTRAAAGELTEWADEVGDSELAALRDPRNWVRPVAAISVGSIAGGALVVLGWRRHVR